MISDKLKNKINGARLCGQVRAFNYADYKSALDYLLEEITKWKTIESIYQVGSVNVPGLSDIDLLIIMKNNKRDISYRYSIRNLSEDIQYIVAHDSLLMDRKTFRNLPYWFPYFNIKHLYGSQLEIDETHKDNLVLKSIFLVNYLITKIPSDFLFHSFQKGYFHERIMENMINSLGHSLFLWAKIQPIGYRIEYRNFTNQYQMFRKKYFELPKDIRIEKLREYTVRAIILGYELIKDMNEYLCTHWFNNISLPIEMSFKTGNKQLVFKNPFNFEEALNKILDSADSLIMYYPISFGVFLHQYTLSKGIIGRHISACLEGNKELACELQPSVKTIFDQHLNTIEHYAWFHSKKFKVPVQGYHTYWAPHSMLKIERAVDKIINRFWWLVSKYPIKKLRKKIRGIGKRIGFMDDFNWPEYYDEEYSKQISELEKEYTFILPDGKYSIIDGKITLDPSLLPLNENHKVLYETIYALKPNSILEVGCGCGDHLANIKKLLPKTELYGSDLLQEQLEFLFQRHPELKSQAHLSIENITIPNSERVKVDLVFTQAVLMHIQRYKHYLAGLKNIFNSSEKFVVLMENWTRHNFVEDIKKVSKMPNFAWENIHFYTNDTGRQILLIISKKPLTKFNKLKDNKELLKYL